MLLLCVKLIFSVVYHVKYLVPTRTSRASFPTVCLFVSSKCRKHCCGCGIIFIVSIVAIVNALREKMKGKKATRGAGESRITGRKVGRGGRNWGVEGSGREILLLHIEQDDTHGCSYHGSKVVAGD